MCILHLFILRFAIFSDDKKNKWKLNLHTILMTKNLLLQWIIMLSCRIWWSQNHIKYCVQSPRNFTDKCWRRGDNNWAFGEYWYHFQTVCQFSSSGSLKFFYIIPYISIGCTNLTEEYSNRKPNNSYIIDQLHSLSVWWVFTTLVCPLAVRQKIGAWTSRKEPTI